MPRKFKHLKLMDRLLIGHLMDLGYSKKAIADKLGVHRSTVYRELSRNHDVQWGYHIGLAENKAKERQRRQKMRKLDRYPSLKKLVIGGLERHWSPEQIAGHLANLGGKRMICHETIYAYIYSEQGKQEALYKLLRKQKKKRFPKLARKRRSTIPNRIPISDRPEYINNRSEFGHWECDLMQFKKGIRTNLITLRERKSRYLIAIKNSSRQATTTAEAIIKQFQFLLADKVKSFTFDNGIEFSQHELIANKLKANTYFCEPYKSYQKGSIENANGLLRDYMPRDIDIDSLDQKAIDDYCYKINLRPMKCLGFKSPFELFHKSA